MSDQSQAEDSKTAAMPTGRAGEVILSPADMRKLVRKVHRLMMNDYRFEYALDIASDRDKRVRHVHTS